MLGIFIFYYMSRGLIGNIAIGDNPIANLQYALHWLDKHVKLINKYQNIVYFEFYKHNGILVDVSLHIKVGPYENMHAHAQQVTTTEKIPYSMIVPFQQNIF